MWSVILQTEGREGTGGSGRKRDGRGETESRVFSLKEAVIRVSWSVAQLQMCV